MDEVLPGQQTHKRVLAPKAKLEALSSSAWSGRKDCGAGWGLGGSWQGKRGGLEFERTITPQTLDCQLPFHPTLLSWSTLLRQKQHQF